MTDDRGNNLNPSSEQRERQRAESRVRTESKRIVKEDFSPAQSREITVTRFLSKKLALDDIGTVSNTGTVSHGNRVVNADSQIRKKCASQIQEEVQSLNYWQRNSH